MNSINSKSSEDWAVFKKAVYGTVVALLVSGVAALYILWLDNYYELHPDLAQAVAVRYVEELPLDGILVWNEEILVAPRDGVVSYPSPSPRRVAKGSVVARVDNAEVRAGAPGYFFPALDGQEGKWEYAKLWLSENFPVIPSAERVAEGTFLRKGEPLGKLAPQPQDLLCIAYLDLTSGLSRDVRREFLNIKTASDGKTLRAEVRAAIPMSMGQKLKVCVALPFFPPSMLTARNFSCAVPTEDLQGVSIPETAVVQRDGKLGVYMVQVNRTWFAEVKGFPLEGGNFFITEGVPPGSVVVLYAGKAKEGAIIL